MAKPFPMRSWFELSAVSAALAALMLAAFDASLSIIPLVLFGFLCLVGSLEQRLEFFLPIIRNGSRRVPEIAVTFDDGPDLKTTPRLLDLLSAAKIKATFFVIGNKAAASPDLIRRILAEGHEIGNHSESHDVFLMLRGRETIEREVEKCQVRLAGFSVRPRVFRPPVGITNPHLRPVLERYNLSCVGFSCRPRDFGNRLIDGIADKVLKKIRPGDILLLHDCARGNTEAIDPWLNQVADILEGVRKNGLRIVPLSRLIGRPVMDNLKVD